MKDFTDIEELDIAIEGDIPNLTLKQRQKIASIAAYFRSPISMATLDTGMKMEISVDYFQKSKSSVCLYVVSWDIGVRTVQTNIWCDVEIGARGGVVGKYDRMDPIRSETNERNFFPH